MTQTVERNLEDLISSLYQDGTFGSAKRDYLLAMMEVDIESATGIVLSILMDINGLYSNLE